MFKALDFRYKKLYSKMFKTWHKKSQLQSKLARINKKLNKVILGFPFYILKSHCDHLTSSYLSDVSLQNQNLLYEYQADWVRNKLFKIIKWRNVFAAWKSVSFQNRIVAPFDYYNTKIWKKGFKAFRANLKQKLIKQRNKIKIEVYRSKKNDKLKGRMFLALLQNVFKTKKRHWKKQTADNFRTWNLLTKGFKGLKSHMFSIETRYKRQPELRNHYNSNLKAITKEYLYRYPARGNYTHQSDLVKFSHNGSLVSSSIASHLQVNKVSYIFLMECST